jgi:hypothetical protein
MDIKKVPEYYQSYLRFLKEESVVEHLKSSAEEFNYLLNTFSNEKAEYKYAENKWSVKDLIQHVIDTERVFAYRAMRFSRSDDIDLPGFDQDQYVVHASADRRDIKDLMSEFTSTRYSTISFFNSLNENDLKKTGIASEAEFSVEMLGYIISGHLLHHLEIIREKYI